MKFAFGLAQHAKNIKLIKNPLETMAKEVTRLVMDARINGESSIKIDAVDRKKISEYLNRLKIDLKKENRRLEGKLDVEIGKIIVKQDKKGKKHDKSEFGDLSEKADFVKKSLVNAETKTPINNEAKVVCDMADKAKFIYEFSKIFNGSSEDEDRQTDAIGNMIVGISQDIFAKLSAADAGSINSETPSFVRRIKDVEQEKIELKETLQLANQKREEIAEENKKIEKVIHGVAKDIQTKENAMNESVETMKKFRFSENQLEALKEELSNNIPVTLKGEYEGFSLKKINKIKTTQQENDEKLEDFLDEHGKLYEAYSGCQSERKEIEDHLEKIEILEEMNRAHKDTQIKKIEGHIKACEKEIADLKSKEKNLLSNLETIKPVKEMLTSKAIEMVKDRHLDQSEEALKKHAAIKGYSSNYRSVGHFLRACLDIHTALRQDIEASRVPDLNGYFIKSDIDVADGMDWKSGSHVPISASVANIFKETNQGEQKYRIAHIYGYVPRDSRSAK